MKKQFFISLLAFFFGFCSLQAQNAPTLLCANQVGGGVTDIEVVWANNHMCGSDFTASYLYESISATGDSYNLVATITDPTQTTVTIPNPSNAITYYYMEVECAGIVSVSSDTLDTHPLIAPEILKVSVSGGSSELEWNPSESPDAYGYVIYNSGAQGFQLIDTVFVADLIDPSAPSYLDVFGTPDLGTEEYDIATIDFCGVSGTIGGSPHTTMFLQADYDSCNSIVNLSWTPYEGWGSNGVLKHTIIQGASEFAEIGGDEFTYAYEIQAGDPMPLTLSIKADNANNATNSISNAVEVDIELADLPEYIYMQNVSVINENQIQIDWSIDPNGVSDDVTINRGTTLDDINPVLDIEISTLSPQVDSEVNTQRDAYYYFISAQGGCGIGVSSGVARTIFLTGQDNFDLTNGVFWNKFEMPNAVITKYTLYRVNGPDLTELATFNPDDLLAYTDDVSLIPPDVSQYCYLVQCDFNLDLPNDFITGLTSFSNTFCIAQTSRVFVPNAFAPNGVNNIFKPVIVYPNEEEYSMIVLNRWGEKVFETNDPQEGWDGFVNGEPAPQDVYPYLIQMLSTNGNQIQRKGTVLLLR